MVKNTKIINELSSTREVKANKHKVNKEMRLKLKDFLLYNSKKKKKWIFRAIKS